MKTERIDHLTLDQQKNKRLIWAKIDELINTVNLLVELKTK